MSVSVLLLLSSLMSTVTAVDRSHCAVGSWTAPPLNVPLKDGLGFMGGMVDGPISGNGDMGLVVGATQSKLLLYVDSMQFHDVLGDTGTSYCGYDTQSSGKRGVGLLSLSPESASNASKFSATQTYANATVHTQQGFDGWSLHTESYVSATENVLITRLWWTATSKDPHVSPHIQKLRVETSPMPNGATGCLRQNSGRDGPCGKGSQWFNRSLGRDFRAIWQHPKAVRKSHLMRIAVGSTFIGTDAVAAPDSDSGSVLSLTGGQVATVVTALHTNRDFLFKRDANVDEPLQSVGQKLAHLASSPAALAELEAAHIQWWRRHWSASGVSFSLDPDGKLSVAERMWYGTIYMLAVTNRVNNTIHLPPSGLWHNFYTSDVQVRLHATSASVFKWLSVRGGPATLPISIRSRPILELLPLTTQRRSWQWSTW